MLSGRSRTIGNPLSRRNNRKGNPLILVLGIGIALIVVLLSLAYLVFLARLFSEPKVTTKTSKSALRAIQEEFRRRYGSVADQILKDGFTAIGSVDETAQRFLQAKHQNRDIVMGFGGYSVTVGRGNYFSQSYPFVIQRALEPVLKETLNIGIKVRNGAIGGIPSFPYAFCFEHFLGGDLDVVSWDYALNEGKNSAIMEAYIRQTQHQLKQPMIIALDTNKQRCDLLGKYADQKLIRDAICVDQTKVIPKNILELPEEKRPPGFQQWDEFGAPAGCPGRGSWHPKKMEHELIGWIMTMYFVQAIERATQITYREPPQTPPFPKPFTSLPDNPIDVNDMLYGHQDSDRYVFKDLSCRTNFLPATDEDKVLPSIVVSGLADGITAENIMESRPDSSYTTGWAFDVSDLERKTKVKVEKCGGLGYIDMKIALYGIPESGPLRLWLPLEKSSGHDDHNDSTEVLANHWFDDFVICEANEKRPDKACHLDQDIDYTVGGSKVASPKMITGAAEYLKRPTCVNVGVPADAKVTRFKDLTTADGGSLSSEAKKRIAGGSHFEDDHVGLVVDIKVHSGVTRKDGACCISHVIWEQH